MIQFPDDPRDTPQENVQQEHNMPVLEATPSADQGVTTILGRMGQGDRQAMDELTPLVYHELKRVARKHLYSERHDHTLQCTALVHEAYLKLADQRVLWQNRSHFFGIAAQQIRRILIDHARARQADKRGGEIPRVSLDEAIGVPESKDFDVLALNEALEELERMDPRQARVVELRFFAGLSVEETAEALGLSTATVKREWATAKLWLFKEVRARRRP